ncbi:MAG: membrane lipoprotein lipid attachment site-containing protein [Candidatus Brocadiaceae bacterium]
MKKTIVYFLILLLLSGCIDGRGRKVTIEPVLDKRLKEMEPIPLHVGLFIDPSMRHFSQEERQVDMIAGVHHYLFSVGEPLSKNIEETVVRVFTRVTIMYKMPDQNMVEEKGLDGVLILNLNSSRLDLIVEDSVWRAIGKHHLAIHVSFLDKNLNTIFEDELAVEGKNLDLIDYETEGGWWKIDGPKYGPAVEDSIEKLTYKLAQRLRSFFETTVKK